MDAGISSRPDNIQEGLEALLVEVSGLANRLKSNGPKEGIPSASRAVLQVLQRFGAQTVPQIARARFSSRQNIQILVNRLQKEALVEFVHNPDHKRSVLIRLTQRGQVAVAETSREEGELNTKLLPSFSETELSSAAEVLGKLRKLLDGREPLAIAGGGQDTGRIRAEQRAQTVRKQPDIQAALIQKSAVPQIEATETTDGDLPVSLL